jgi:mycoredoxin
MTEVDIERDPEAADYVMKINGGFQTVPTVLFGDGSTLTNPSVRAVKQRLAELAVTP